MKKSVSRTLAMALATCMAAGTLAACGSSGSSAVASSAAESTADSTAASTESGTPDYSNEDPINIRIYLSDNATLPYKEDWLTFTEVQKRCNVNLDVEAIPIADYSTKVSLALNTGENVPDVILYQSTTGENASLALNGALVPISDYSDWTPNFNARVEEMDLQDDVDMLNLQDGKRYYMPSLTDKPFYDGGLILREDYLESKGLEAPKTFDDLYEILKAYKADYPDSYPLTILAGPRVLFRMTMPSFGISVGKNSADGSYVLSYDYDNKDFFAGAIDDKCKEYFAFLNKLYSEGLLDPECLTQDSNLWANKVNAGEVASFPYLRLINTALTPDVYKDFKSILPPADPTYGAAVSAILEVPEQGAILTSTNANPVASLKWIDAQLETETMMVAANGKVGEQIQLNDEGKYEVINVPENNGLYSFVPVTMGQFFAPGEYYTQIYQMAPHRVERYLDSEMYAAAGVLEHKSYQYVSKLSKMDNEDAIEAANIYTELKKFMEESVTDFIKNGVTDESYNTFVETAKAIGVERYIELYQNAYDAYLAK